MNSQNRDSQRSNESATPEAETEKVEGTPADQHKSYEMPEEVLRMLIDREPKRKGLQGVLGNQAVIGLVGIVLGILLTYLANLQLKFLDYKLGAQQQDIARSQKIVDDVGKLRIEKIGEVWERLDQDEFAIDNLLAESKPEASDSVRLNNNARSLEITKLINNDQALLSKYRFWLGEDQFGKARTYLNANVTYSLHELGATSDTNSNELRKVRDNAKTDILKVRDEFFRK